MRDKTKILVIVMVFLLSLPILTNAQERDSDLDGTPDSTDKYPFDYDNDGMPDIWEKKNGLRYDVSNANEDPDNDGIKNINEYKQGTNPLTSDKTGERIAPELLTPVERTMARGLIWVGVSFFIFTIVILVLYRTHISRIFRFMHHISKEHFEKRKRKYGLAPIHNRKQVLLPRRFVGYPKARFVQRPIIREAAKTRITQEEWKSFPERRIEKEYISKPFRKEETIKKEKASAYTAQKEPQKAYPKEESPISNVEKKKDDVFERLSNHIQEYKKVEKHRNSSQKLAKI